jgi:hypothetical protein
VMTMKNAAFCHVTPCDFVIISRLSVSYRLTLFFASVIPSTLKMEAARSCETSVYNKRRYIPEGPPLRSSGQSSWLQIRRPKKRSSGSGTGSTQPREYN